MNSPNLIATTNTQYFNDPASNNRSEKFLEDLTMFQDVGIPILIVDGGSTNEIFLEKIHRFKNINFFESKNGANYSEQIASTFKISKEIYPGAINGRCEPEKLVQFLSFLNQNKEIILEQLGKNSNIELIGLTREKGIHMPNFMQESEKSVAREINQILQKKSGLNLNQFMLSGDYIAYEGPGSLFGPVILTQQGVNNIIKGTKEISDGNTVFFRRKGELVMQSSIGNKKIGLMEMPFSYDQHREIDPENKDTKKMLQSLGFSYSKTGIEDFQTAYLNDSQCIFQNSVFKKFEKENPHNLAVKRVYQHHQIKSGVSSSI